jgi:hypothetical protein
VLSKVLCCAISLQLNCCTNISIVLIDPVYTVGAKANQRAIFVPLHQRAASNHSYNGPSFEKILAMRKDFVTPSAVPFYRSPLLIHKGDMQYLFDHKGVKYLDMFGGIVTVSVGHCHP